MKAIGTIGIFMVFLFTSFLTVFYIGETISPRLGIIFFGIVGIRIIYAILAIMAGFASLMLLHLIS